MNITVVYGVDIFGDHTARPSRIIDTERRTFDNTQEALDFAAQCTECVNEDKLHSVLKRNKLGAKTFDLPLDQEADGLLLNRAEFSKYKENY